MTMLNSWTIPSLTVCLCCVRCTQWWGFTLLAARAYIGSYWACCKLVPWDPSLYGCSAVTSLPSKTSVLCYPVPAAESTFVLVKYPSSGDCPLLHLNLSARPLAPWGAKCISQLGITSKADNGTFISWLRSASLTTGPWEATLVTGSQLDAPLLTTTLWDLSFSCLFYQCTANLLTPQLESLSRRILWRTPSKALLKSGKTTLTFFPSSTGQATR